MMQDAPEIYSLALLLVKFENLEKAISIPLTEIIHYVSLKVEKDRVTTTDANGTKSVKSNSQFLEQIESILEKESEHEYGKITDWVLQPDNEEATPKVLQFMHKHNMGV